MKKMALLKKEIIFVLISGLLIVLFSFIYTTYSMPLEVHTIDVKFSVGNEIGLNAGTDEINYGTLIPGMSSIKKINIENNFDFDIVVKVLVEESLKDYLSGEDRVIVRAGESIEYPIKLHVPYNASFGDYSGKIRLEIKKNR